MKMILDKFVSVLTVAMMATVCVTLMTACGGGDDDPLDNPNPSGINTDTGKKLIYFQPYMVWGSSMDQVKSWMAQYDWLRFVSERANVDNFHWETGLANEWNIIDMQVMYEFFDGNGGLTRASVWYDAGSKEKVDYLIAETERLYGVVLVQTSSTFLKSDVKNGMSIEVCLIGTDECTVSFHKSDK